MARAYVDSSVLLAILLREGDPSSSLGRWDELVTSELTDLECRRTLDRIRIQEGLGDAETAERLYELEIILKALRVVQVGIPVLKRAKASFPTVVRSLDAIHLATAELASAAIFLSRDKQQITAARAIGLNTEAL